MRVYVEAGYLLLCSDGRMKHLQATEYDQALLEAEVEIALLDLQFPEETPETMFVLAFFAKFTDCYLIEPVYLFCDHED